MERCNVIDQGGSRADSSSDQLWNFSTVTSTWRMEGGAGAGEAPIARASHGMSSVGDDIYVFGGSVNGKCRERARPGEEDSFVMETYLAHESDTCQMR